MSRFLRVKALKKKKSSFFSVRLKIGIHSVDPVHAPFFIRSIQVLFPPLDFASAVVRKGKEGHFLQILAAISLFCIGFYSVPVKNFTWII